MTPSAIATLDGLARSAHTLHARQRRGTARLSAAVMASVTKGTASAQTNGREMRAR